MTTVVAAARDGIVVMAADSCTNVYDRPIVDGARKIARLKAGEHGEVLIGFSGDGALRALVTAHLKISGQPDPADAAEQDQWADAIAIAITELAVEAAVMQDGRMSGTLLLGAGGHLWTLTHAQAIRHPDGLGALGTGEGPAIGALAVLLSQEVPLPEAVVAAANVGIRYSQGSEPPVYVEQLPGQEA